MEDNQQNSQPTQPQQAPMAPAPEPQPTASTPATTIATPEPQPQPTPQVPPAQPTQTTPATAPAPASAADCKCPTVNLADWDKRQTQLDKTFYKTFSPRLFYIPFSFAVDVDRATRNAKAKGYNVVENGMVMDTGGMFLSSVLVEVTNANPADKDVISLAGKQLYTKASTKPWNQLMQECQALEAELGKKPTELYFWYTACPKCQAQKEVKTVLIAVQ